MRIGITTFFRCVNYGATLQCFALQKVLSDLGYDVEVVNDSRVHVKYSIGHKIIQFVWQFLRNALICPLRRVRNNRFIAQMRLSKRVRNDKMLICVLSGYDVVVTGSDQVWAPINIEERQFFFDDVPGHVRKMSYAASFGVSALPDGLFARYRDRLKRFNAISVREKSGVEIVRQLTGESPVQAVDPTLLLPFAYWDSKAVRCDRQVKGRYVLCYFIKRDRASVSAILSIAEEIARREQCSVVLLNMREWSALFSRHKACPNAGPQEFLRLVFDAVAVVTDSFHGVVFSIVYGKRFVVPMFCSVGGNGALQGRIYDLLHICGLEDRCVPIGGKFEYDGFARTYRRDDVERHVRILREESLNWLKSHVGNEGDGGELL